MTPRSRGLCAGLIAWLVCAAASAETAADLLAEAEMHVRTRDPVAAVAIWKRLAERDVREAQYRLGVAYRAGRGVETSHARAFELFQDAAAQGHAGAQFALGTLFQNGWGVTASRERALESYQRAARNGHRGAQRRLDEVVGSDSMAATTGPARIASRSSKPDALLLAAIRAGDATAARDALERGAAVDSRDAGGRSPLHAATSKGRSETVDLLIRYRAEIDATDTRGTTPLMLAAERGHTGAATRLLDAGADPNARDALGRTSLMLAALEGKAETARRLEARGARRDVTLEDGRRAADLARRSGHAKLADSLAVGGVRGAASTAEASRRRSWLQDSLEAADRDVPPLVSAAHRGQREVVETLLDRPDAARLLAARDREGHTALTRAAERGHLEILKDLLAAGADVSVSTPDERAPLAWAATAGHANAVRALLAAGAAPDAVDARDRSALAHAAEADAVDALETLLAVGASPRSISMSAAPLVVAARASSLRAVEILLGADPDRDLRATGFCAALGREIHDELVSLLADSAPDTCDGEPPIEILVRRDASAAVRSLLDAGMKPTDHSLLIAAKLGRTGLVERLIEAGLDVNLRGADRETPLIEAAAAGHLSTVELLLGRGADPALRNRAGYDAKELAERHGHTEVTARIEQQPGFLGKFFGE